MPKVQLDKKSIRREPPAAGQIELRDTYLPGFGLRIASGGARTYFVMRRCGGRMVRRTIARAHIGDGPPAPGELSVADARDAARDVLAALARGIDPKSAAEEALRRAQAEAAEAERGAAEAEHAAKVAAARTFKAVAEEYLADGLQGGGANLKSRAELERKLTKDLQAWHARPIDGITEPEVQALVRAKAQRSGVAANRLLSFIKRVFAWAKAQGRITVNPARDVPKQTRESSRDRFLNDQEIRLFWKGCEQLGDPAGRLFRLLLVTGQRRGEVAGLRRSELGLLEHRENDGQTGRERVVQGDAWLLPAERMKRGVAHTVPLSTLAKSLIDEAPTLRDADNEPLNFDHVLASGARGDQAVSGWSRYKAELDEAIGRIIAEEAGEPYDAERHRLAPWHLHDLRATCATHLEIEPLSVSPSVIARVLGHAEGFGRRSTTSRYLRHRWDREAADALEAWGVRITALVGANVVPLKGARA